MKPSMLEIAKGVDSFFMRESPIHDTMRRLSALLSQMNIPFAIAGAMAANAYGHQRTTVDVDVLIRRDDLQRFKDQWLGRGWMEKFEGSKGFKDAHNQVTVDILLAGDYPGDGLPKPVVFPEPQAVAESQPDGLPYLPLATLIELKLASGMTAAHRIQDLADVMNLIRVNRLPLEYRLQLNPYVHSAFERMWQAAQVKEDY